MLIKSADDKNSSIELLEKMLKARNIPEKTRDKVWIKLGNLRKGIKGEQDSAYEIDFYFGPRKGWMIIHDLRLECDGRKAQIDHLLINRFLEIYVIETKNFSTSIEITEQGEFNRKDANGISGIDSPIEQNQRHIEVLKAIFEKKKDKLPTRLGLTMKPEFKNVVLFSSVAVINRPKKFDTTAVIKVDQFKSWVDNAIDNDSPLNDVIKLAKVVSPETVLDLSIRLRALHKPSMPNYLAMFGLSEADLLEELQKVDLVESADNQARQASAKDAQDNWCFSCKDTIGRDVAQYCWDRKPRFGGRLYCRKCQKAFKSDK